MKVAYIGNFEVSFSTESHVALSLESLGHTVLRLQEQHVDWAWVPSHAAANGVDFVLWTHTHGFAPEDRHAEQDVMLARLREAGIPSVAYHLDKWWDLEREHQTREPFFRCDIVCTADGGHDARWAELGVNHVWMPPAVVHTELGRGTPLARASHRDVGFVGNWREYGHAEVWPWRFQVVAETWRRYGSRFRSYPRGGESIRGMALNNLYASLKVVLGDSCLAHGATRYWSDRVPETLGRGGLLVHPFVEGLDEHYPQAGLPLLYTVGDIGSVFRAIDLALGMSDAEREQLTDDAIDWAATWHTYRVRMDDVCALVDQWKRAGA